MAEFWAENQAESSSAKVLKSSSDPNQVAGSAEPTPDNPRTVISSFKQPSSLGPQSSVMRASNLAGEMLGHFRLDDYVGMGGMGAVFRGTDIRLDRPVAIKVLPPDQAANPEIMKTLHEFSTWAKTASCISLRSSMSTASTSGI
jgi:hypothetical protein